MTKLDSLFDEPALDHIIFGIDIPSHLETMSLVNGALAVPSYLIIHKLSGADDILSFLGMMGTSGKSYYESMFNSDYRNVLIIVTLMILFTLKQVATTAFVLSVKTTLGFFSVDLLAKLIVMCLSLILVEGRTHI